jgi:hypothetical protein
MDDESSCSFDNPSGPPGSLGQPPEVLASWVEQLIAQARQTQVQRLLHVRVKLQSGAFEWDDTLLGQALEELDAAVRGLDFGVLRRGWLDRLLGRHRAARQGFITAHERVVAAMAAVKTHAGELAANHQAHASAPYRVVAELDAEWQALSREVAQGVSWLQQMCEELGRRAAAGPDTQDQLAVLAERARAFTQQFKRLQDASSAARDAGQRARGVIDRRSALLELVRGDIESFEKVWTRRVGNLATEAAARRPSFPGLPKAIETHEDFVRRVGISTDACAALQGQEQLMDRELELLGAELED